MTLETWHCAIWRHNTRFKDSNCETSALCKYMYSMELTDTSTKSKGMQRSRKCLSQSEVGFAIIGPENTNLLEDVVMLLPVKFRWILSSGYREEVKNVSINQRPGRPSWFPIGPKNTNFVEEIEILLPVKFRWICTTSSIRLYIYVCRHIYTGNWNIFACDVKQPISLISLSAVSEKKCKMCLAIWGQGCHLGFPIGPEKTHTL